MADSIHDIGDYGAFLTKQFRSIRHFERCLSSIWCADHLLKTHSDLLSENLLKADLHTLRQIVDELRETLLGGVVPGKDQIKALDMDYMAIDADDPVAIDVQNVIGLCILCCRRRDVGLAE